MEDIVYANIGINCSNSHPVSLSPASYLAKGKKVDFVYFDQKPVHKHVG